MDFYTSMIVYLHLNDRIVSIFILVYFQSRPYTCGQGRNSLDPIEIDVFQIPNS